MERRGRKSLWPNQQQMISRHLPGKNGENDRKRQTK